MVTRQASFFLEETLKDLDDDQKKIIESYLQGHHIILIGGAGCGKSYVMKRLIRLLHAMYGEVWCKNRVAGVAMTNTIANNMSCLSLEGFFIFLFYFFILYFIFLSKGQTIFNFLGLGVGKNEKDIKDYMDLFLRNLTEDRRKTLSNLKLLFGDESFLFSNLIFAVFYAIFEYLFESSEVCPLSRLQICLVGDPKQLLVFDNDAAKAKILAKNFSFAKGVRDLDGDEFFSKFFEKLMLTGLRVLFLKFSHRTNDSRFLQTLNEVRKNVIFYLKKKIKMKTLRFEMVNGMSRYVRKYQAMVKVTAAITI